jgi:hypothetical protein
VTITLQSIEAIGAARAAVGATHAAHGGRHGAHGGKHGPQGKHGAALRAEALSAGSDWPRGTGARVSLVGCTAMVLLLLGVIAARVRSGRHDGGTLGSAPRDSHLPKGLLRWARPQLL